MTLSKVSSIMAIGQEMGYRMDSQRTQILRWSVTCHVTRNGFQAVGPTGLVDGITDPHTPAPESLLSPLFPFLCPPLFLSLPTLPVGALETRRQDMDTEPQQVISSPPCYTDFSQHGSGDHLEGWQSNSISNPFRSWSLSRDCPQGTN